MYISVVRLYWYIFRVHDFNVYSKRSKKMKRFRTQKGVVFFFLAPLLCFLFVHLFFVSAQEVPSSFSSVASDEKNANETKLDIKSSDNEDEETEADASPVEVSAPAHDAADTAASKKGENEESNDDNKANDSSHNTSGEDDIDDYNGDAQKEGEKSYSEEDNKGKKGHSNNEDNSNGNSDDVETIPSESPPLITDLINQKIINENNHNETYSNFINSLLNLPVEGQKNLMEEFLENFTSEEILKENSDFAELPFPSNSSMTQNNTENDDRNAKNKTNNEDAVNVNLNQEDEVPSDSAGARLFTFAPFGEQESYEERIRAVDNEGELHRLTYEEDKDNDDTKNEESEGKNATNSRQETQEEDEGPAESDSNDNESVTNSNKDTAYNSFASFFSSLFSSSSSPPRNSSSSSSSNAPTTEVKECGDNRDLQEIVYPPINPYVSRGAWPVPHHDNYATAAGNATGVDICEPEDNSTASSSLNFLASSSSAASNSSSSPSSTLRHDILSQGLISANPINLFYTNDNEYLWGSSWGAIMKINRQTLQLTDYVEKELFSKSFDIFHGAYSLLSNKEIFYVGVASTIEAYYDVPNTNGTKIKQHETKYDFSTDIEDDNEERNTTNKESIRGLCMTYDGYLVWVTNRARVGVVNADLEEGFNKTEAYVDLRKVVEDKNLDMSNNIACDETHAIYIVSNKYLHKLVWSKEASNLTVSWSTPYDVEDDQQTEAGRLGSGSGATPTIMGSGDKKYVVITDGSKVMKLVVIRASDGKIVNQMPVTFGQKNLKKISSEQSLLVHGYKIVAVNNTPSKMANSPFTLLGSFFHLIKNIFPFGEFASEMLDMLDNVWPVIVGDAPRGVQQFKFDPTDDSLCTTWTNQNVSIPNAIPSMSTHTNLVYGIGRRALLGGQPGPYAGMWTLEALSWETGLSAFYYNIGMDLLKNSIYAATIVGPGEIVSGIAEGVVRVRNAQPCPASKTPKT